MHTFFLLLFALPFIAMHLQRKRGGTGQQQSKRDLRQQETKHYAEMWQSALLKVGQPSYIQASLREAA